MGTEEIFRISDVKDVDLAVLPTEGAKELAKMVDKYLVQWYNEAAEEKNLPKKDTFLINSKCPRFTTGDGKELLMILLGVKTCFLFVMLVIIVLNTLCLEHQTECHPTTITVI